MHSHVNGLIAAPLTPMHPDGTVNTGLIPAYAGLLHRSGVRGAFVCGTTGESLSLTVAERLGIAEAWCRSAPPGFLVIIHVGHNSLEACRELAAHAEANGAWAIGVMPPCFFKPESLDALVGFCGRAAAAAPSTPCYYYHIPSLTGVNVPMVDFLAAAAPAMPTLCGVKFTSEDLMDYELCRAAGGGRFDMLFGRDEMLLCARALGARGAVGSTYNWAAPLYLALLDAFDAGDLAKARKLQRLAMEAIRIMQTLGCSFFAAAKAILRLCALEAGPVRPPLVDITPTQAARLEAELIRLGYDAYLNR